MMQVQLLNNRREYENIIIISVVLVIQCPALPNVLNALPSFRPTKNNAGVRVQYYCKTNHYYNHTTGSAWETVTCLPNGQWSTVPAGCTGE